MTLTKADLIDPVYASNRKMTKAKAREAVETILYLLKGSLENGEGSFYCGKIYVLLSQPCLVKIPTGF